MDALKPVLLILMSIGVFFSSGFALVYGVKMLDELVNQKLEEAYSKE